MNKSFASLIFIAIGLIGFSAAADCHPSIKLLKTQHMPGMNLCQLQHRYKAAISKLREMGIQQPSRIGNVLGPRFIKLQTWKNYLSKNGDSEFAAWKVYEPSPTTWGNWSKGVRFSQTTELTQILKYGSPADLLNWIARLHAIETSEVLYADHVGKWRIDVVEYIPVLTTREAYTLDQIERINRVPYVSSKTGEQLVKYTPVACTDFTNSVHRIDEVRFKLDAANLQEPVKACGDLIMAPQDEVMDQMNKWAAFVLKGYRTLSLNPQNIDVLSFVSHLQQWFVIVHPFVDGNGRTSRLMMDIILTRFGLPTVVLDDMERDFFASGDEWAGAVGKGMLNTVIALENCIQNPTAIGCKVVSVTPPKE